VFPAVRPTVDVFVVDTTGGREALVITASSAAGISADRAYENRSMKAQMKAADRSGAPPSSVIVGTDELAAGTVTVRPMRGGEQSAVARADMVTTIQHSSRPPHRTRSLVTP
jgi:histidyl-tRNA synthetase